MFQKDNSPNYFPFHWIRKKAGMRTLRRTAGYRKEFVDCVGGEDVQVVRSKKLKVGKADLEDMREFVLMSLVVIEGDHFVGFLVGVDHSDDSFDIEIIEVIERVENRVLFSSFVFSTMFMRLLLSMWRKECVSTRE